MKSCSFASIGLLTTRIKLSLKQILSTFGEQEWLNIEANGKIAQPVASSPDSPQCIVKEFRFKIPINFATNAMRKSFWNCVFQILFTPL